MKSLDELKKEFDEMKKENLAQARMACMSQDVNEAIKRLGEWMIMVSSQDRPFAFLDFFGEDHLDDYHSDIFWSALHDCWTSFDAIPHDEFRALFALKRNDWKSSLLAPDDLSFYNSLPESFEAYRGTDANARHRDGLSWTIDREVAEKFARGHRSIINENPIILTATINKSDIVGAYTDRDEREIVLFDPPKPRHIEERIRGKLGEKGRKQS